MTIPMPAFLRSKQTKSSRRGQGIAMPIAIPAAHHAPSIQMTMSRFRR
jgi:hypothetical protein